MSDPLVLRIPIGEWRHGLGKCPSCGLPVGKDDVTDDNPRRDCKICPPVRGAVEEFHRGHFKVHPTHEVDLIATHKRCGTSFYVVFESA